MTPPIFLRRFLKRQIQGGIISGDLFECDDDEKGISVYDRPSDWGNAEIGVFQASYALPSGCLPGVLAISAPCFPAAQFHPPQPVPSAGDPFSFIHCESPCNDSQAQAFAEVVQSALASGNAQIEAPFIRPKR